jgi:hypothetical protein
MSVLALGAVLIVPVVRATDVIEPPRVKFPVLVTVPVKVKPLTVPVPPTEVTVPVVGVVQVGVALVPAEVRT